MKQLLMSLAALASIALASLGPAHASRTSDLVALSEIFGQLHYVRRMCEPDREADLWRERMKQLVAIEQPTAKFRRRLIEGFNVGFRDAQTQFTACTADAELYSIDRAAAGETLIARLSPAAR